VFKRQTFFFSIFLTYRPSSFKHLSHHTPVRPSERIDCCDRCVGRRNNTVSRSFLVDNNFSTMIKLHQTCIAGFVKYLPQYTGRIWNWTAFAQSPFVHRKRRKKVTERCSYMGCFQRKRSSVYKWRHSDVIV